MPQEAAHPNTQFEEDLDYIKFATPDTPVYTSQTSCHVPVFYWHTEQLQAATAAGAVFEILQGPSPFGGFGEGPNSFREMHIDPTKSWDRATAAITQQAAQLHALEQDGTPLRPKDIEGGLDSVRYGYDALFPKFRRCQWKSVRGKPVMREPRLPDDETDMDMSAFYKTCIKHGLKDMEMVSKIRLYGVSTNSTCVMKYSCDRRRAVSSVAGMMDLIGSALRDSFLLLRGLPPTPSCTRATLLTEKLVLVFTMAAPVIIVN